MDSHNKSKIDERAKIAYGLWLKCYTLADISHEMGCAISTAHSYVEKGRNFHDQFYIENLNHLREARISQIKALVRSRLEDLRICVVPKDLEDIEVDHAIKSNFRNKSFIINDLLRLYQELSKVEGLYDSDRVDVYITKKDTDEEIDIHAMEYAEINAYFQKLIS